jgi:hypothetical protein
MIKDVSVPASRLTLTLNFFEELKRLGPGGQ